MKKTAAIFFTFNFSFFISPKAIVLALLLLLSSLLSFADSKITRTYTQRPLPEVLIDIDNAAPEIEIRFIYNKLEDYTVTCTLHEASPIEAIQQAVGFYPIKVSQKGATVIVEPQFEAGQKLIGRIVDDKGRPLEFANVQLFFPSDNSLITGGVTNAGGDFVIPCSASRFTAKISYIGYETLVRTLEFPSNATSMDVGTLVLKVDPKAISEVVVENDLATASAEKSTFYPTRRHRNAAYDAVSLLHHMMIPQLRLNPLTGYVTTLAGESVSIFIDFMPASAEDLAGLNTQDVRRVDIYDYPSDARFQSKPHVINFIMQKYETGGYTKLTTTESVLDDFSGNNSVYSKLSHKNWTFDANATVSQRNQHHIGSESTETFNLPAQTITRTEDFASGKKENRQTSFSLRAIYASKQMQLANRQEFLDNNTPRQDLLGTTRYNPTIAAPITSVSRQDKRELTPTYKGNWYFFLPKSWTLSINPSFQYSHIDENRFFQEVSTIENFITEDVTNLSWSAVLRKNIGKKHTLCLTNSGLHYNSEVNYTGSTLSTSKLTSTMNIFGFVYQYRTQRLTLHSYLSYIMQQDKVNGAKEKINTPGFTFQAQYSPAKQHSLSANMKLTQGGAIGSLRNPSVMQENELMFYCGNPEIKNMSMLNADIQYTWMPSNTFSASAFAGHIYNKNYFSSIYRLTDDGQGVLRIFTNAGNYHQTQLNANLTLRLFDNKLQLNVSPIFNHYETTGEYRHLRNTIEVSTTATWYTGQFYFQGYYCSPQKYFSTQINAWHDARSKYSLTAGWGNARWKANLTIANPFRTDWRNLTTAIHTPLYTRNSQDYNAGAHQSLKLTVSYTFNYGKKVKQGSELGTASGGQSSIL